MDSLAVTPNIHWLDLRFFLPLHHHHHHMSNICHTNYLVIKQSCQLIMHISCNTAPITRVLTRASQWDQDQWVHSFPCPSVMALGRGSIVSISARAPSPSKWMRHLICSLLMPTLLPRLLLPHCLNTSTAAITHNRLGNHTFSNAAPFTLYKQHSVCLLDHVLEDGSWSKVSVITCRCLWIISLSLILASCHVYSYK